jgi:hypothetical protein
MAKGIEIGIASETRAFKQGIDAGIIAPLDDAQQALEDLARTKGPEKLEQSLNDTQTATEQLGRETRDVARDIERQFRESYRGVQQASNAGIGGARESVHEFKQEALQNFSEVTSSFDGSMSSIQDLAQGTLGGLASGIAGPIGLAAGAGAAAIGLIGAAVQGLGEKTQADQAKVAEWAQSYIDAGGTILTSAQSTAKALDIITDPERFKEAETNAENWGVTTATAIAAMTGQQWAIDAATASVDKLTEANKARFDSAVASSNGDNIMGAAIMATTNEAERGAASLQKLKEEMKRGVETADVYSQYLTELAQNTAGATSKIDKFGDSIYSLPDGTKVYIDAETGQATSDLDAIEKQIYGLPSATLAVDTAQAKRDVDKFIRDAPTLDVVVRLKDTIGRSLR